MAVPVLDGAGVYFEAYTGLLGRAFVWLAFTVTLPFSVFRATFPRHGKFRRFGPAAMQIAALLLVFGLDVGEHIKKWNFDTRLPQRLQVIDMLEEGAIQPGKKGACDCFYAQLPRGYRSVSAGGDVLVSRHAGGISVSFFVTRWGMFPDDDYTAFIYRSDSGQPQTGVEDTDQFTRIEQLRPNWFYVEHT